VLLLILSNRLDNFELEELIEICSSKQYLEERLDDRTYPFATTGQYKKVITRLGKRSGTLIALSAGFNRIAMNLAEKKTAARHY